nr:immunoglobulin light chain junction region [Macaca mulatta]MOY03653.1 immunoglobulin light chain junction region [Macaca mulatta]MOY04302.1 immunoglobulin light chain junction region [Macaca mulatta]
CQQYKDLPPTF